MEGAHFGQCQGRGRHASRSNKYDSRTSPRVAHHIQRTSEDLIPALAATMMTLAHDGEK